MSRKKSKLLRSNKTAPQPQKAEEKFEWFEKWAGPSLIVIVFSVMAFWSWRKWPDLLVDFGQQLYIPWQLAGGKLLYRDIVILHGPLSQYFNAFWFKLFGPSLTVLIFVNLAILAGITVVLYKSVRRCADSLTATAVCLVLLTLFGFSQYVRVGNYNYVTPYTHEATHGIALTAAMILALSHYLTRGGHLSAAISGICLGLALLTKVEVALAAFAVVLIGFAMARFVGPPSASPKRDELVLFCGMALAPALGFYLYFLSYLPAEQALHSVGQGFFVLSGEVTKNVFYMRILGLDKPGDNLSRMLIMFVGTVIFILGAVTADVVSRRATRHTWLTAIVLGLVFLLALYLEFDLLPWLDIPRVLPLTTSLALAVFVALLLKHPRRMELWPALLPMVLWTTFALGLLFKMVLNVHLYHYGFYLAMPATLVLVICLTYWIPTVLRRTIGCGVVFRTLALAILAAASMYYLNRSQKIYRLKNFAVGKGGDTIFTYGPKVHISGLVTSLTLEWTQEKTSPESTLIGLPEGIMLNYLSRRATTSPYLNFMMGEMIVFGEKRMVDDLKARPSDYVILVDNDPSEFGVGPFGTDPRYGQQIMDWVKQHYTPITLIGGEPLQSRDFGIKILKHNNP
ncbi:MAG TPA: glycosyltransferase family 39 protein [Candidatus Binatia bacterium]|nr:glycosyltransferase family 39 protein [Candidatus Binatia bacterium]